MIKITQNQEKCIGCGSCAAVCPEYWEISSDGKAVLKDSKLNSKTGNFELELEESDCNKEATDICPVKCINIIKQDS